MKETPKVVENKSIIRFQDCDPFNHLNNGSYINYFMNHREDMLLEHYNLDIYKMAKNLGKSWVSTRNQIAYLRPAFLMEKVVIESQLINYTDSTLLVEMRMYNENKSELKSVFWAGFTHFNLLSQKRELHSEELSEFFQTLINPIKVNTFEERILQIKSQKKKPLKEV